MKILLCTNSHLPTIGGRELVVHHLATQFIEMGHDVLVAGPGGVRRHRGTRFNYPIMRWPGSRWVSKDTTKLLAMAWTRLRHSFDVIHAHTTYPNGYVAARTGAWSSTPLVITPHGYDINVIPEIGFGLRLNPRIDAKIRYALDRASRLTAISTTIAASLEAAGADPNKIIRIGNGVDLHRFRKREPIDVREHLAFPKASFLVSSVGNYHPRKGHEVLVEAVRIALASEPNLRAAIVGSTSEQLRQDVQNKGLSEYIRFLGKLPVSVSEASSEPDMLAALLQQSDLYVSSSMNEAAEGLSLALLEGMAAGACPVVSRISGNRDVVEHERNGLLVSPGIPRELADAFIRLMRERELLHRMKQEAQRSIESFGWRAVAHRYMDLYESLLD